MPPSAAHATDAPRTPSRMQDLVLPAAIVASVLVILVPLPPALMDVLLAANIGLALLTLLTTIYVLSPLEFTVFPSLLLAATLGRLVLNVAITRLVLTRADSDGLSAAGEVVRSFGQFVAGDDLIVGLIIFAIILVIQFVVITKGSTRISEVAARFALDGMPGKQMAIDADVTAGLIDQREAQRRRADITRQADFFGAMDGASKFVRGDAIAALVITAINIGGGLAIGLFQHHMGLGQAASLYTKLTIGDGLVSQVPALLTSLAAGLLVTRSTSSVNLPRELLGQLASRPQALAVTGVFLVLLVFTNLPRLPLLVIGAGCAGLALQLARKTKRAEAEAAAAEAEQKKPTEEKIEKYLAVDPMELEIGLGLIRLADPRRGGDLLERIGRVRQNIAAEIGIILPKVRVRDNIRLEQNQYRIKIADTPVADAVAFAGMYLAVDTGSTTGRLPGIPSRDPVSGARAVWIESRLRQQAESLGYTVNDAGSVLDRHLAEIVRRHADELLTRDAARHLIAQLRETQPAVVDELIPDVLKPAEVQQILQLLLRERVPIRQLGPILEALGDHAGKTKNPVLLAEHVRQRLARVISSRYRDRDHRMYVVTLDPALEDQLRQGIEHGERELSVHLPPHVVEATCRAIGRQLEKLTHNHRPAVLLVSPQIRAGVRQLTAAHLPHLAVLSYSEITRDTVVESVGVAGEEAPVELRVGA